jgi:hypothetical protein
MNREPAQRVLASLAVLACFAVLAWLNGRHMGATDAQVAIYTGIGVLLALVGLAILTVVNLAVAAPASASGSASPGSAASESRPPGAAPWGYSAVWGAVVYGSLVLLPFSVLALLAELAYGWQAAAAFIQAGVMTSGAAAGAELMRGTGGKTRHLVASVIVALALSAVWIAFSYVFQRVAA